LQATKSSTNEQDAELLRILNEVESKYGIGNAVANAVENEVQERLRRSKNCQKVTLSQVMTS
jgi:hypothetical protein